MQWVVLLAIGWITACAPAAAQPADLSPEAAEVQAFERLLNEDPSDDAEARRLFEMAAAAGRPEAINALSSMVGNGIGGPVDLERARALVVQAADAGSLGAHLSLSDAYIQGAGGFPRDPARGYRHAVLAAESNLNMRSAAWAQWRVGMMNLNGVGVPADASAAYAWVARAADNGAVQGMLSRAVMLATGQGVAPDPASAREWYRRAAESGELGSAHGLRGLGGMLVAGEGGPIDLARGYAYLVLAQEGGDQMAAHLVAAIENTLDDRTRAAAQMIITTWRIEHTAAQPDRIGNRVN
jgi:TPR repeat protein